MYGTRIIVNNPANTSDNALYLALNTFGPSDNPSSSSPSEYSDNGVLGSTPEAEPNSVYIPKILTLKPNYATPRYCPYPYKPTYLPSRMPIGMQIKAEPKKECHTLQYQKWQCNSHQYQPTYLPTPVPTFGSTPQLIKDNMTVSKKEHDYRVSPIQEYKPSKLKVSPKLETDPKLKKLAPKWESTRKNREHLPISQEIIREIEECIQGIKQSIRHSRLSNNMGGTVGSNLVDQVSLLLWNYKVMAFLEENLLSAKRVNKSLRNPH